MHILINYYALNVHVCIKAVTAIYTPCGTPLHVAQWNKVLNSKCITVQYVLQTKRSTSVYYYIHVYIFYML
jgi:hypothetical protein